MEDPGRRHEVEVRGDGTADLRRGFDAIALQESRRAMAVEIIEQVLAENQADDVHWYKPPRTDHLAFSWGSDDRNRMWVSSSNVRVRSDGSVTLPVGRAVEARYADDVVGWLLPGATTGDGGGSGSKEIDTVLCPEQFVRVPAGEPCSHCEVVHDPAG